MPYTYSSFELFSFSTALRAHHVQILAVACAVLAVIGVVFTFAFQDPKDSPESPSAIRSFGMFFYASFLKPHTGDSECTGQQAALESFYKAQVTCLVDCIPSELTVRLSSGGCIRCDSQTIASRSRGHVGPRGGTARIQSKRQGVWAGEANMGGCRFSGTVANVSHPSLTKDWLDWRWDWI